MKAAICVLALVAGCATTDETDETAQPSSTGAICANPSDPAYQVGVGANTSGLVNDGIDDTPSINKAVCAAVCPTATPPPGCTCGATTLPGYGSHAVCLPAGELDVTRSDPTVILRSIPLFGIDRLTFYGQGPASVLAMRGDGAGTCSSPCMPPLGQSCEFAPWKMIEIRGTPPPRTATPPTSPGHIEIRDLTMTSIGVHNYDKDGTRYVELGDQKTDTDDLLIKNVRMINSCGDHLYAIGGNGIDTMTGTRTFGLRVVDSTFGHADRRAIVIKHGVERVVIASSTFETDAGAIDFDPSSSVSSTSQVIITNNTFRSTSAASIDLLGESDASNPPSTSLVATNNLMFGPGFIGGGISNVEISNNTIFNTLTVGPIAIDRGQVERLDISSNTIVNLATNAQIGISVISRGTTLSPDVRVSGNSIVQASANPAIEVEDVEHQVIANNVVAMTSTTSAAAGIRSRLNDVHVRSVQISGNSISGSGTALAAGISANFEASKCSAGAPVVPPDPCSDDTGCVMAHGFCHAGTCNCGPTMDTFQVDRNLVTGAQSGIAILVGTFGSPAKARGFLGAFPMFAHNDLDATVQAISNSGMELPRAYVIGGNRGGPVQLVGDGTPQLNGSIPEVVAPNGSTYMVRGGTSAATPALYYRENNTWVAQ